MKAVNTLNEEMFRWNVSSGPPGRLPNLLQRVLAPFFSRSRRTCSTKREITSLLMLAGTSPAGEPQERKIFSTTPSITWARISPDICTAEPFTATGRNVEEGTTDSAAKYRSSCRLNSSVSSRGSSIGGTTGSGSLLSRDRRFSRTAVVLAAASESLGSCLRSAGIGGYLSYASDSIPNIFIESTYQPCYYMPVDGPVRPHISWSALSQLWLVSD